MPVGKELLMDATVTATKQVTAPKKQKSPSAACIRREARAVLSGHSDGVNNRLILILGLTIILTVTMTVYLVLSGFYNAAAAIWGEQPALDALLTLVFGVCFVFLILPMIAALWRMACLMAAPDGETVGNLTVSAPAVSVADVFYPFSSPRAYGRAMTVAMESLAWLIPPLLMGIAIEVGYTALVVAEPFPTWLTDEAWLLIADILYALSLAACCGVGVLMLFLSGRRAGFGYYVFLCNDWSLRDVRRYFRGFKRSPWRVFCLRLSLVGWVLLSIVGVLLPFVVHTAPYGLLCSACYAASLERRRT